jgi:hypothetical protein
MKTICLSENANVVLKEYLKNKGYDLIEIGRTGAVYDVVSSHSDIYLCRIGDGLIVAPEQLSLIGGELQRLQVKFTAGDSRLGFRYPENVKYNAAQLGNHLIHNTKHTDRAILDKADELGLNLLHVNQGYTKCNLVPVVENAVITSDEGLAAVLGKHGIEVLLISIGHVALTGFPYGFLGGASGRVGEEILFNGNLSAHPDFEKIGEFIREKGLKPVWFESYPLEDIGSVIQL